MDRAILETVFGDVVMASVASANRRKAARSLLRGDSGSEDILAESKQAPDDEDDDDDEKDLVGSPDTAGKLQV